MYGAVCAGISAAVLPHYSVDTTTWKKRDSGYMMAKMHNIKAVVAPVLIH